MTAFVCAACKAAKKAAGFALIIAAMSAPALAVEEDVPEIDAGSLASAVAMLVGGAYLVSDRVRRS